MKKIFLSAYMFLTSATIANADPITAIITAVISGIGSLGATVGAFLGGLVSFTSLSAFLLSPIGSLILGLGIQLLLSPFLSRRSQQSPTVEAGKVNVRVAEPERWLLAGSSRSGGGVVFAEFDSNGNFWYVIVHSDTTLGSISKRYFDNVEITLNGDNDVITNDFCLNTNKDSYTGSGTRVPYFRVWTTTHTAINPTPPAIAALQIAFPGVNGWTPDHKLVGTTYSVIRVKPLAIEHRYKIYKWRGPVGVGEPAFSIVGEWALAYDPRDNTQTLGNKSTYKFTRNPVLVWAWFRTHRYGRNKSETSINWEKVAQQATICDQTVFDKDGAPHVRYRCDTAIPESKERAVAEQEILMSMDGQIIFDDDGKTWVLPGYYYAPNVFLSRNRDIIAMESVEAVNGESETQGVIVRYLDPEANYQMQPSAAWDNPLYYVEGQTPKYLTVDIPTCQDHNQAMRLAKAYGEKSQPAHKIVPIVGLRGLKARQERAVNITYDNTFAGDYEIVAPVEVEKNGFFCGMALVPLNENRWVLLPGEEKNKPVIKTIETSNNLQLPTSVVISFTDGRLEATFDPVPRDDWRYEFQYKLSTSSQWLNMATNMTENLSYSGGVQQNKTYQIRYRTVSSSGKTTLYVDPVLSINTQILTLSGTPVVTGTVGVAYSSWSVSASGGDAPYAYFDLFGRLPPGISINPSTGLVSGTPTTAGTYADILIRVTDSEGALNNFPEFDITIAP